MASTDPVAAMSANLATTTGKSLDEWTAIARQSGTSRHGELVAWLKGKQGLTHGYANLIAHSALRSDAAAQLEDGKDLVAEMFAGEKSALRPIYDALISRVKDFGTDIELVPKKGYVSLRRKTQFATLHPSTKVRFDLGLKLRGAPATSRLEAAGSWNAMVTHRVRLESANEVDEEVANWLRRAYDQG